jgi:hypothetical protein
MNLKGENMEEKILEWLCDFIIPLDIRGDEVIEKVWINSLTSDELQVGIDKVDGTNEIYKVNVTKFK